ncbi:MAG: amidohydrolase [Candidatus Nanopelagicales bacterium]
MGSYLLIEGHVYSPADPFATAMLVVDGTVAWVGDDAGAVVHRDSVDQVRSLQGALVTPAFVDPHVHATATGLLLTGLDLSGCGSLAEFTARLRAVAAGPGLVLGHGWDETGWPEGRPPTAQDVQTALGDRPAYLTRVDVHSAVVSPALLAAYPEAARLPGFRDDGRLSREAHHRVREGALGSITAEHRRASQQATLRRAASLGIASLHENGGPSISSAEDFLDLLALGRDPDAPDVVGYWGELHGHDTAAALGARGAAGDLFVDGALGSRTACLRMPYADMPESTGTAYLSVADVAAHVSEATVRGTQAGFHVIGDGAADIVVEGLVQASREAGADAVRRARHRLEHVEMLEDAQMRVLADLGVVASVQPAFDAAWGGETGMYAERLGASRARTLNPFSAMAAHGVMLALGSDAPVTPLDPWGSVRAAVHHRTPEHRISTRAAFAAHTRGGRRAAHEESTEPGVLAPGSPATYAVWAPGPLTVEVPDERVAAWSTDPRSGTPGLPDLTAGTPECWRTAVRGRVIFDAGALG